MVEEPVEMSVVGDGGHVSIGTDQVMPPCVIAVASIRVGPADDAGEVVGQVQTRRADRKQREAPRAQERM